MEAARPARLDDLDALVALATDARAELAVLRGGDTWRRREARPDPIGASIEADLAAAPDAAFVVVGTVDGVVVGYGVLRFEDLHGEPSEVLGVLGDLYVAPDARHIGVGEAMLALLVESAERRGAVGIDSMALPGDRATKNFFESFGMKARAITVHRSLREEPDDDQGDA